MEFKEYQSRKTVFGVFFNGSPEHKEDIRVLLSRTPYRFLVISPAGEEYLIISKPNGQSVYLYPGEYISADYKNEYDGYIATVWQKDEFEKMFGEK